MLKTFAKKCFATFCKCFILHLTTVLYSLQRRICAYIDCIPQVRCSVPSQYLSALSEGSVVSVGPFRKLSHYFENNMQVLCCSEAVRTTNVQRCCARRFNFAVMKLQNPFHQSSFVHRHRWWWCAEAAGPESGRSNVDLPFAWHILYVFLISSLYNHTAITW